MMISVESFKISFHRKLFTEIFGDLIKNPSNICSPKIFAPNIFAVNVYIFCRVYKYKQEADSFKISDSTNRQL